MLGAGLPETVWFYEVDRARGMARTRSQDGTMLPSVRTPPN
jgi:hypothetical protein